MLHPGKHEGIGELIIDKQNRLWAISRNSGIEVFNIHPEKVSNYLDLAFNIPPDKITGSIRSCIIDKTGLVWIGTRDHGLFAYKLNGNNFIKLLHFNTLNGLTDNFVTSVSCDSSNNIIAGTQTGLDRLFRLSENSYRVENLSKTNNFFAYIKNTWADSRQAYALTSFGIELQVSGTAAEKTSQSPQLLMEEMKVNAKTVLLQKSSFDHKQNNISFYVAAPSFIDEKQIRYSYLVQGSGNTSWSDTTSVNSIINLTNLSAGKYILNVKAFFPSGTYTPSELKYSFEIEPPWWQTWWFRVAAGLLIIGLLIIGFRFYYRRKLEKKMVFLEKQQAIEKERTRIATDMHDDLGAGLSRIKFLSENIKAKKVKDETILDDIDKISAYSDEMAEKMGEIVWSLNQKNDTIADLIAFTRSYVLEYLSTQNIHCDLDTPIELPSTFITGEMRQHIFLSVKECLHNIAKHAEASQVYFSVKLNGAIEIMIHDNGKGIDWDKKKPFSNGIQNIQKRMNEVNGKVIFRNEEGAKVIMSIPYEV
jgi:two-component sensor histidine kinase